MIILKDIAVRRGPQLLIEDVNLTINPGQKLALIGANGCGKSSFFALLTGALSADKGDITGMANIRLAHMAQEVSGSSVSAHAYVFAGHKLAFETQAKLNKAEANEDYETAAQLHQIMDEHNLYGVSREASLMLEGLGFPTEQHQNAVSSFSGGWRIRLNLARALLTPSDLLLLDEPTNHLDLDATVWLQNWLNQYQGTIVLISHDRDFIDAVCERIVHVEHQRLNSYTGNYSQFEEQRADRLAQQQALFEKQTKRIAEIEAFVARFRYKATKAKQAQSRLKELERLPKVAAIQADSPFQFRFLEPKGVSDPLLKLEHANIGYQASSPVLSGVNLTLRPDSRIGLIGRNGAGKSTLLKALVGDLDLLKGERAPGAHCKIGYFNQHQLEALDLEASPLQHLLRLRPDARDQEALNFLGGFDFRGDMATDPIAPRSGGEKARLALAQIVWQAPNVLILDEPTNHLDLMMRAALEFALQGFQGAVILVTHDRHLLRNCIDELYLVDAGKVRLFENDLHDYEQWILSDKREVAVQSKTPERELGGNKKAQRQDAATRRAQLQPLQKAVKQAEKAMGETESALSAIREKLADETLYSAERKQDLTELLAEEGRLARALSEHEEAWLLAQEALEEAEQPFKVSGHRN
jgi:ATP-binding cassette subfamily F protein 3